MGEKMKNASTDWYLGDDVEPPDIHHQLKPSARKSCKSHSPRSKDKEREDNIANFATMTGSAQLWAVTYEQCGRWVKKTNVIDSFEVETESSHNSQFDPP